MTLAELLKDVKITAVQYPGAGRRESWQDSMIGTLPGGDIRAVATDPEDAVRNGLFLCASQDPEQIRAQVSAAQAAGARCALVAEFTERDILQLRCADMRQATAFVFANFHGNPQKKLRVIGVTGTNGKTTTTTLIRHILRSLDRSCGLIGTNGDAVGANPSSTGYTTPIPQILFAEMTRAVESGCEFLVMEASSHSLAQKRVEPIRFELAVFTNLTRDHLDYHGSMEAYLEAKKRLFVQADRGVVNIDDNAGYAILEHCAGGSVTYGRRLGAAYMAEDVVQRKGGVEYTLVHGRGRYAVTYPVPGLFSVYNSLAAIASCHSLGLPLAGILEAVAKFEGVAGRMETIDTGLGFQVVIDYAHTPDGLENVLRTIRGYKQGRLIALFGCGGNRDRGKRPQMCRAAASYADFMVVTSDNPRGENPYAILKDILAGMDGFDTPFAVIENRRDATKFALEQARAGDVVLLAGKGHEDYQIIGDTVYPYDEKKIVQELIKGLRE